MSREIRWKLFRDTEKSMRFLRFWETAEQRAAINFMTTARTQNNFKLKRVGGDVWHSDHFIFLFGSVWWCAKYERPPDEEKLYILDRALWCSRMEHFCVEVYIRTLTMVMMTHELIERSMSPQRHNWSTRRSFFAVMIRSIIHLILQLDVCFIISQPF